MFTSIRPPEPRGRRGDRPAVLVDARSPETSSAACRLLQRKPRTKSRRIRCFVSVGEVSRSSRGGVLPSRVDAQAQVVRAGTGPPRCGAGWGRLDPARREERAPGAIQRAVVAVDVPHVDPGAHDVTELHSGALQQFFGQANMPSVCSYAPSPGPYRPPAWKRTRRRPVSAGLWNSRTRRSCTAAQPPPSTVAAGPSGTSAWIEISRQARSFSGVADL